MGTQNKIGLDVRLSLPAWNQSSVAKSEDWKICADNSGSAPFSGALKPGHTSVCAIVENHRFRNWDRLPGFSPEWHGSL
jgi:hypothetical protein